MILLFLFVWLLWVFFCFRPVGYLVPSMCLNSLSKGFCKLRNAPWTPVLRCWMLSRWSRRSDLLGPVAALVTVGVWRTAALQTARLSGPDQKENVEPLMQYSVAEQWGENVVWNVFLLEAFKSYQCGDLLRHQDSQSRNELHSPGGGKRDPLRFVSHRTRVKP